MALKSFITDLRRSVRFLAAVLVRIAREPYGSARRIARVLAQGGVRGCVQRFLFYHRSHLLRTGDYSHWLNEFGTLSAADCQAIQQRLAHLPHSPLLSLIMPVFNPPLPFLRRAVESVRAQLYPRWELCIADDASTDPRVRPALEQLAGADARIRVAFRPVNGHIAAASNTALEMASGEYVALLDQDDMLPPHALYLVAEEVNRRPDADVIFSDEDKIDLSDVRCDPYFKPGWSWELIRSQNMVSHLGVYRTALVRALGGFRSGFEGSQDYDLLLRCAERATTERICHIPDVLYHWRAVPGSAAEDQDAKPYACEAAVRALREHLCRSHIAAEVSLGGLPGVYRIRYQVPAPAPLVSVILTAPPEAGAPLVRPAVDYPAVEWVDAKDRARGIAASKNAAVAMAQGELLCFLDAGLTPADPGWLLDLVGLALQPDVGVVGALRHSCDGYVTHGGLVVTADGQVTNLCVGIPAGVPGLYRVCITARDCAAVCGRCLIVRRDVFDKAGGFDSETFPNEFHDVDFCLRTGQRGYRVVWTPHVCFTEPVRYHPVEQVLLPPGDEDEAAKAFRVRWAGRTQPERFLSPHYNPHRSDFSLILPPPVQRPWKTAPSARAGDLPAAGTP